MLAPLLHRFRKQTEFATGYAPLYARLFAILGDWVEACSVQTKDDRREVDPANEVVEWLAAVSQKRNPFDVPLLLLAGLHRDVLAGDSAVAELATFYPTVSQPARSPSDPTLPQVLHQAILARREPLAAFIRTAMVQTNETGRGLAWLLPLLLSSWTQVDLLDLGASAGLNLVAEQRHFQLNFASSASQHIGRGDPPQFQTHCSGLTQPLETFPLAAAGYPEVLQRYGVDLAPLHLRTKADELRLMSFVWADHPQRLVRLQEGLAAFRHIQDGDRAVQFFPVRLPDQLGPFLDQLEPANRPLIVYNTYITQYFRPQIGDLRTTLANWAQQQERPVLWLQWEPLLDRAEQERLAPEFGWCAWTADLWDNGHRQWRLGWVHPHGTTTVFGPGLEAFMIAVSPRW